MDNFNAKVGEDQHENWVDAVDRFGLGKSKERGSQLLQFCTINGLVITNILFCHSPKRRVTWISPDNLTMNQIDYILVRKKIKSKVKNSRTYHSADKGSDHFLVLANLSIKDKKTKAYHKNTEKIRRRQTET